MFNQNTWEQSKQTGFSGNICLTKPGARIGWYNCP